jgi:uncharacterized membrane protein
MKKNMGKIDKGVRILVALMMMGLIYMELIPEPWSFVVLGLAGIFVLTSVINFCPLYVLFGINTCKNEN